VIIITNEIRFVKIFTKFLNTHLIGPNTLAKFLACIEYSHIRALQQLLDKLYCYFEKVVFAGNLSRFKLVRSFASLK